MGDFGGFSEISEGRVVLKLIVPWPTEVPCYIGSRKYPPKRQQN